ncbi:MAG: hypothetical protein ACOCZQ_00815 [Nanoarchaeota archaeon]
MVDIGVVLRHYKREDIQKEMCLVSEGREVAVKFGEKGFGKRPDTLHFPRDVLEFAKQRATSFHVSEERWFNPLQLEPGLKPKELDEMRKGWDLVLDIDIPDWKISKIITWLLVKSLKENGIRSVSCKFSGNKGFHIGVPFEAFPDFFDGEETRKMFPEICKKISFFLIAYIGKNHTVFDETNEKVTFGRFYTFTLDYIAKELGKEKQELLKRVCSSCREEASVSRNEPKQQFECSCGEVLQLNEEYTKCPKCSTIIAREEEQKIPVCKCGSTNAHFEFNPLSVIEVDTLLISSRHMYRMVYSLHEKSGLCSVPVNPEDILNFKREMAEPGVVEVSLHRFLDTSSAGNEEGIALMRAAIDSGYDGKGLKERETQYFETGNYSSGTELDEVESEIPADFFPPCIHEILKGLYDGKKRAMFILINFLSNTGYSWERAESILFDWNKRNNEELREVLLKGQLRYRKTKGKILPPNCSNKAYYKDLGVCNPDNFCQKVKNPANYSIFKSRSANSEGKKGRQKLTDEQKEMRRKWREKRKEQKDKKDDLSKSSG